MQSAEDQELQLVHLSMHLRIFAVRHQLLASERSLHMAAQQRHELAAEVRNVLYFLTYAVVRYLHTATRYIEVLSTGVSWWIWSIHARNILAAEVFYLAFPEYAACVQVDDWTFELQEHSRKRDEALARKWWFGNVFAEYPASWVFEIEPHWDAKTTEHGTWLPPCTMGHHGTMRP